MDLRLGRHTFGPDETLMMAIVNRTRDSFYDAGSTYDDGPAQERVHRVVHEGAEIVDIGGVKAGPGDNVDAAEEIRRVAGLVAAVRGRHPEVVISVDTWRGEVGEAVAAAGADLLNDVWGGADPRLAAVAAASTTTTSTGADRTGWRRGGGIGEATARVFAAQGADPW